MDDLVRVDVVPAVVVLLFNGVLGLIMFKPTGMPALPLLPTLLIRAR